MFSHLGTGIRWIKMSLSGFSLDYFTLREEIRSCAILAHIKVFCYSFQLFFFSESTLSFITYRVVSKVYDSSRLESLIGI